MCEFNVVLNYSRRVSHEDFPQKNAYLRLFFKIGASTMRSIVLCAHLIREHRVKETSGKHKQGTIFAIGN